MKEKKSRLYTGTGDGGSTSLVGGRRISKTDQRLACYGTIDELNAHTGLLVTYVEDRLDREFLIFIQHILFHIGAYLATDPADLPSGGAMSVSRESIEKMEREIDRIDGGLPVHKTFILPGGSRASAVAHVCRTVCRRGEREVCGLLARDEVDGRVLVLLNRLSDYFFVLSRRLCLGNGASEIIWDPGCI